MMKLIRWTEIKDEDTDRIVSPFFAEAKIEARLLARGDIYGLGQLLQSSGHYSAHDLGPECRAYILGKVRSGEWLLVTSSPSKPLSSCSDEYLSWFPHLSRGFRGSGTVSAKSMPAEKQGPGKWKTISVKKHTGINTIAILANRMTSMGDEGRVFGSDGKDLQNTMQTVTQQWVPLNDHDAHMKHGSVSRAYGTTREIDQRYLEGDDHWQVSGKSWHWSPPVASEVYEQMETKR